MSVKEKVTLFHDTTHARKGLRLWILTLVFNNLGREWRRGSIPGSEPCSGLSVKIVCWSPWDKLGMRCVYSLLIFLLIFLLLACPDSLPHNDYKSTGYSPYSAICLVCETKSIRFHLPGVITYALQRVHGSGHFLELLYGMGRFWRTPGIEETRLLSSVIYY